MALPAISFDAPSTPAAAQRFLAAPADLGIHTAGRESGEMVIEMELGFDGRLDESLLSRALELLLDAEPILACRLVVDAPQPCWQIVPQADRTRLIVTRIAGEYEAFRTTGLDPTKNVQVELCLGRHERGDRLIIKMTHEVGDGVGLQLLTSRLSSLYSRLCTDSSYRPSPNLSARRDFGQILSSIPARAYPRIMWDFATFLLPRCFPPRTHALQVPHQSVGPWTPVIKRLSASRLSSLTAYSKARGSTLNDLFLSAAYRALASCGKWDGSSGLRISMTVDLRRWCFEHAAARSICNLSSFEYPFLARKLGRRFDDTLANVTALTRRRKESWPGLAPALVAHFVMQRYASRGLRRDQSLPRRRQTKKVRPSLTVSNEGRLDKERVRFGEQVPAFAHIVPPFLALPCVHICLTGYDGGLTVVAVTARNGYATVDEFLDVMLNELPSFIPASRGPSSAD